jgi:hypothetical protein
MILPSGKDIAREVVVVLAGAVIAAFIVGRLPRLRAWMREQWDGAQPPR